MKMFSDCSGPCETCANFYSTGSCMAGHGDDHYVSKYDLEQTLKHMSPDNPRFAPRLEILEQMEAHEGN